MLQIDDVKTYIQEIIDLIRCKFVDGSASSARGLINDCVIVARNRHYVGMIDKAPYGECTCGLLLEHWFFTLGINCGTLLVDVCCNKSVALMELLLSLKTERVFFNRTACILKYNYSQNTSKASALQAVLYILNITEWRFITALRIARGN